MRSESTVSVYDAASAAKASCHGPPQDAKDMKLMHAFGNMGGLGVLSPVSPEIKRWEAISVVLLLYTALFTPFEIAFLETKMNAIYVLNRVVDFGFFVDLTINFRLAYLDKKSRTFVLDSGRIIRHYLRGWFVLDAVTLIPWDVIEMSTGGNGDLKVLRLLKILKLTKLVRMLKSASLFKRLQADVGMDNRTSALVNYLIIIIATMHWVACGWGIVAAFEHGSSVSLIEPPAEVAQSLKVTSSGSNSAPESDGSASWLHAHEADEGETISMMQRYALCLEYSLSIMCMGYGTTEPTTPLELWFSIAMMLIAGVVTADCLGCGCPLSLSALQSYVYCTILQPICACS
jgi:hypothetical protein